jgi:23S rRNA (guanosine2251-2'-O)-methyltransferase
MDPVSKQSSGGLKACGTLFRAHCAPQNGFDGMKQGRGGPFGAGKSNRRANTGDKSPHQLSGRFAPAPSSQRDPKARKDRPETGQEIGRHGRQILYGLHAVNAALANPRRRCHRLWMTDNARGKIDTSPCKSTLEIQSVRADELDRLLGTEAVHQGCALEAEPLAGLALEDLKPEGLVLVLDQVTDPHNVGAILRSAAAFGVKALITTERHSPQMTGLLAKTASGALEHVPIISVVNLAQTLATLREIGFWSIGLDSEAPEDLNRLKLSPPLALVLGAEGKGLRRLTRERCDVLARLDMPGPIKSLNVSNAAAICLSRLIWPVNSAD